MTEINNQLKDPEQFDLLPNEIIHGINEYLKPDRETEKSFSFACRLFNVISHNGIPINERLRVILAQCVAEGNQAKANEILIKYPELLLERGTIKDKSGRIFKNTTVWEYSLWALDVRYMCPMMLNCLAGNEQEQDIKAKLLGQLEDLETKGIDYELDGVPYHDVHFDFSPLIKVLGAYIELCAQGEWEECTAYWNKNVGKELFNVPAHVAQHYCDPKIPFTGTLQFDQDQLARILTFFNHVTMKSESWWPKVDSESHGIGRDLAPVRGNNPRERAAFVRDGGPKPADAQVDLDAMTALSEVRLLDRGLLKKTLQNPAHQSDELPDSVQKSCNRI